LTTLYPCSPGGTTFVATQAVGWTLFSLAVVYTGVVMQAMVSGVLEFASHWALGSVILLVLSQVVSSAVLF
jgi:hypothetical protein